MKNVLKMKCRVKAFGIARDIIGARELEVEITSEYRIANLKETLYERFPRLRDLYSLFIAINHQYAEDDTRINESDEIALIPPVAGG